jgi:hypothetical protein
MQELTCARRQELCAEAVEDAGFSALRRELLPNSSDIIQNVYAVGHSIRDTVTESSAKSARI